MSINDNKSGESIKIKVESLCFSYKKNIVLEDITAQFPENSITAVVGPSGAGKSTFLLTLNRLWENISGAAMKGKVEIRFNGKFHDIYRPSYPLTQLRRSVGIIFQNPNPLPMSIYKNIAFPLKLVGYRDKKLIAAKVEQALNRAYLWKEVKDRLEDAALSLSLGQQQRLCIARALVLEPEVLLMDEPASSLDSKAGAVIEELLVALKEECTLIVVSHYMDQVKRLADTVLELSGRKFISVVKG